MPINKDRPKVKEVKFPVTVGVKVDFGMLMSLEQIAEYERLEGKSTLVRSWIIDGLRRYSRNPAYKRWMQQKAERAERMKKLEKKTKEEELNAG